MRLFSFINNDKTPLLKCVDLKFETSKNWQFQSKSIFDQVTLLDCLFMGLQVNMFADDFDLVDSMTFGDY